MSAKTTKKQAAPKVEESGLVVALNQVESAIFMVDWYKADYIKAAESIAEDMEQAAKNVRSDIANFVLRGQKSTDREYLVSSVYGDCHRVSHPDILRLVKAQAILESAEQNLDQAVEAFETIQRMRGVLPL